MFSFSINLRLTVGIMDYGVVCGCAVVHGRAKVLEVARVRENAWIGGDAVMEGSAATHCFSSIIRRNGV